MQLLRSPSSVLLLSSAAALLTTTSARILPPQDQAPLHLKSSSAHRPAAAAPVPSPSRDPDGFLSPTVTLSAGLAAGTRLALPSSSAIVDQFLGVPFAAPPERFEPPTPEKKWKGVLQAKKTKPACIQQFAYPEENHDVNTAIFNSPAPEAGEDEDCLYLNVYRPETVVDGVPRAVMFWLYPGGLQFGDASRPIYNGSVLAGYHDVIVVTPNFRSNVFGFSNAPELRLEHRNAGFWDQRRALQWVQENIAAFGGDPARVTLFGNSAGGTSIDRLITTTPVDPPFAAAVVQSGQASWAPYTSPDGAESWAAVVDAFGCGKAKSELKCMKKVPAAKLKKYIEQNALLFTPTNDNVTQLSTSDARKARAERNVAMVPVLVGNNGQEGSAMWRWAPDDLDAFLGAFFGDDEDRKSLVKHLYPLAPEGVAGLHSAYERLGAIFTDLVFTCPTALWANDSASANIPTWRYFYNASFPSVSPLPRLGAYHTGEVPFVFGTYADSPSYFKSAPDYSNDEESPRITPAEYAMSNYMQRAWTSFAKNPVGGPGWNKMGGVRGLAGNEEVAVLTEQVAGVRLVETNVVDSKCWAFREVYEDRERAPFAAAFMY